jgi:glycosyltransferase involved in cell wall biosynthesis
LALAGDFEGARSVLLDLLDDGISDQDLAALVENDLGVLDLLHGQGDAARMHLNPAAQNSPCLKTAEANLVQADRGISIASSQPMRAVRTESRSVRVAVLSLLFNWPSTGGGTVHTAELVKFLKRDGFDVRHFHAQYSPWAIGDVAADPATPREALKFSESEWTPEQIQRRFRSAVDRFSPDYVIITDSWNFKPLLAEAIRGYRYFLRIAALEGLCPLNNVRLLVDKSGTASACPQHQFATPGACRQCVQERMRTSGGLHQAERVLSGYGTPEYDFRLRQAFAEAEGVLVVNPLIAAMVSPYTPRVHVVPSGFDLARFPKEVEPPSQPGSVRLLFAGLVQEYMKGFRVAHDACARLWSCRQDFELVATGDPDGDKSPFTRYIGWQSQEDLPRAMHGADVLLFPTVAEEALGRTAVEAMGAGRPVIASRIGGLQFTVQDEATGLLCNPDDPDDLARKICRLLDDRDLRLRMGRVARKRFLEHWTWGAILERHYRKLLVPRTSAIVAKSYRPKFREDADVQRVASELAALLGTDSGQLDHWLERYRELHRLGRYSERFGELKTLSFEEAFVLYAMLQQFELTQVVEIGSQAGKSTRRILDMLRDLGVNEPVVSFDVVDELEFVDRNEIEFHCKNLEGRFRESVLDRFAGGLIFLDAHPYGLIQEIVRETTSHPGNWVLAIHDCVAGLCNPHMSISPADPHVTSETGIWERHILAEAAEIPDPCSSALDDCRVGGSRLRVFSTRHGLALLIPERMLDARLVTAAR